MNIPKDFPVQPLKPGEEVEGKMTCGTCGLSWDDDKSTSITPVPSGRCPFEQFHEEEAVCELCGEPCEYDSEVCRCDVCNPDADYQEKLETLLNVKEIYRWEGEVGVENFKHLTRIIGYAGDLDSFLEDNPGAVEALANFIFDHEIPEWEAGIDDALDDVRKDRIFKKANQSVPKESILDRYRFPEE